MKIKAIIYSVLISLAFIACDDDLSSVGLEIQPDGDKISVRTDTVSFTSSTQVAKSIFVKTPTAYLGSLNDPVYGNVRYGYLCNFYTSPDNVFPDEIANEKIEIDSVIISLLYKGYEGTGFIGDSLATMEATIYKVDSLGKNFYSDIDPTKYITKDAPVLVKKAYTSRNLNVSDSIYFLDQYYRSLDFKLSDNSVGEKIYKAWKEQPEAFKDLDKFFKIFPGVYIESTFGSGNILIIDYTYLQVYYQTRIKGNISGQVDSLVTRYALFSTAAESTLLNIIDKNDNQDKIQEMISNTTHTFLKTPAGVVTQLEISLQDIVNKIGDDKRIFNNVKLTLDVEEQSEGEYLNIPSRVLLINSHPDSVKTFFEEARLADNNYSYYATRTASTSSAYKYDFGNISNLIQNSIKDLKNVPQENWPPLKLWVIPVEILTDANNTAFATTNYFTPAGAKLKSGKDNLKLSITTTKSNK